MPEINNIVDRTNRFYLEMSRRVLGEKEYDIIWQMLVEKRKIQDLSIEYNLSRERIRQIFAAAYQKVKSITEILTEIEHYKKQRDRLREDYYREYKQIQKNLDQQKDPQLLKKKLVESAFPFSRRLWSMLGLLDVYTYGDLAAIPLQDFQKYRGFKRACKKELVDFIEFEHLEDLFDGFQQWKRP